MTLAQTLVWSGFRGLGGGCPYVMVCSSQLLTVITSRRRYQTSQFVCILILLSNDFTYLTCFTFSVSVDSDS